MSNSLFVSKIENPHNHRRLDYIDSLRGIAAILVVLSHAFHVLTYNELFLNFGKIGVFVFFLISGFVIPFSLGKTEQPYRRFLVSRFFRLYPAYWFSIFLFLFINFFVEEKNISVRAIISNITMIQMALGIENIIGVYWTLFIELVFYCLCIILFFFGILSSPKKMVFVFFASCFFSILISLVRYKLNIKLPVAVPLGLMLMFFGCAWRSLILDGNTSVRKYMIYMIFSVFFVGIIASYLSYSWDQYTDEPWQNYAVAYVIGLIFFMFFTTKVKILSSIFIFLGAISYSLYLVHEPIVSVFKRVAYSSSSSSHFFLMICSILVSISVAYAVYKAIELPSIKIGRKLI